MLKIEFDEPESQEKAVIFLLSAPRIYIYALMEIVKAKILNFYL